MRQFYCAGNWSWNSSETVRRTIQRLWRRTKMNIIAANPTWDTTCSENFHLKHVSSSLKAEPPGTWTVFFNAFFLFLWQIGNPDPSHLLYTPRLSIIPEPLWFNTTTEKEWCTIHHVQLYSPVLHYGSASMILYCKI